MDNMLLSKRHLMVEFPLVQQRPVVLNLLDHYLQDVPQLNVMFVEHMFQKSQSFFFIVTIFIRIRVYFHVVSGRYDMS
jgi:hypothetical protein